MNEELSDKKILPQIDHFVVVMFENRSFDNMLGGLYPKLTKEGKFEGVKDTMYNPKDPTHGPLIRVPVWQAQFQPKSQIIPYPDPGELFEDMNQQIFSPNKVPVSGPGTPTMGGFVANYLAQGLNDPEVNAVMQYYAPDANGNIPITSLLASNYAVSDCWHASAPVQTIVNRTFVHSGQASTYVKNGKVYNRVNNSDFLQPLDADGTIDISTIFEALDNKLGNNRTNWKVYYHDWPISALFKYVDKQWHHLYGGNVYQYSTDMPDYADFEYDVKNNSLPAYSFIEPRYSNMFTPFPNSNHPGGATIEGKKAKRNGPPPISICHGEQLLKDIYTKLASNPALFEKTLLIVTYDEHGGLFDHVPPPGAKPPTPNVSNFDYSRFGVRVPAIFINPYIKPNTIFRPKNGSIPFDHTSIISTLRKRFNLGDPLTDRDKFAPTFDGILNSTSKNTFGPKQLPDRNCPPTTELTVPEEPIGKGDGNNLSDFLLSEMNRPRNAKRKEFISKVERAASLRNDRE